MRKGALSKPSITLEEAKAQVALKTAPRVTEQGIEEKIDEAKYIREGNTTICILKMRNGFVFIGHSTPASPANFDEEIGKRYAYENAFRQIWTHEGYLLRESLQHG